MKTITVFLCFFFLCSFSTFDDSKVFVHLETRTEGNSYQNYILSMAKNDRSIFKGIPPKLTESNSVIKRFDPGKNDSIFILLGDLDSLSRICVIDANRNLDFSDDYVYQFDKHKITDKTNFPAQPIFYKRVVDDKEVIKQTFFRPLLFDNNSLKVEPNNDLFHKYFVMLSVSERYEGCFSLENKTYKVVVLGTIYSQFTNPRYAIVDSDSLNTDSFKRYNEFKPLNEKTLLNNYLIDNLRLNDNHSILTFDMKNILQLAAEEQQGYEENFYALHFQKADINGQNVISHSFKGKYTLLDFWGTWCTPCIKLLPHIATIHKQYPELQIISIANEMMNDDGKNKIPEFIKKYNMNWSNIVDVRGDTNAISTLYNVSSFPTTILIDPDGKIIHRGGIKEIQLLDQKLEQIFLK